MSEATEFLVFCSPLKDTPHRLEDLLHALPGSPTAYPVIQRMAAADALAVHQLECLRRGDEKLPDTLPTSATPTADSLLRFLEQRRRLVDLLDSVDEVTPHALGRLSPGRTIDPWSLAGGLADHDVTCLAKLHRFVGQGDVLLQEERQSYGVV